MGTPAGVRRKPSTPYPAHMTKRAAYLTGKGFPELQRAEFDGSHGRYAYFDTTKDLGIQLELLEWNETMEKQV